MKTKLSLLINNSNFKDLILIVAIFLNLILIIIKFNGSFYSYYGADYLAYWSAGKIADQKGYSEIYDLNNLRSVQTQELRSLNLLEKTGDSSTPILPVAYFSFFILPFQILSKFELICSYWVWTILNLIILVCYLVYFLRSMITESGAVNNGLKLLIVIMISYPVLVNFIIGQVEVLLVVCAGEFIRNAIRKKTILSGLWLGGLLVKPQLLILIIPIILMMHNWKVLLGFIGSSGIILMTSLILSGFSGTKDLINLWIGYSGDIVTSHPDAMINWRMVGLNFNSILNTSLGWCITGLGMILTVLALYILIKKFQPIGSSSWVIVMLGVFSATLAITWHSHQHMAMVLLPFLVYGILNKLLSEKILLLWAIVTPVVMFGMAIIGLSTEFLDMVIAFSGFALNLVIFSSIIYTTAKK